MTKTAAPINRLGVYRDEVPYDSCSTMTEARLLVNSELDKGAHSWAIIDVGKMRVRAMIARKEVPAWLTGTSR